MRSLLYDGLEISGCVYCERLDAYCYYYVNRLGFGISVRAQNGNAEPFKRDVIAGEPIVRVDDPLVSIVINNYNYGSFLSAAIDSCLNQSYDNIEVIVVDDGSTDDSRDVMASYGDRIISVFQENGGQASALNAGVAASRGEMICLLDADDCFFPNKVEQLIGYNESDSIIHHPMQLAPGPGLIPSEPIEPLDAYRHARDYGYLPFLGSPTSGTALHRDLARRIFPIPTVRGSADDFVVRGAALLGKIVWVSEVLGTYRIHNANNWYHGRQTKPIEYMREIESYLNRKLVASGKAPVIDFYHGMYGVRYIPQTPTAFIRLGFDVFMKNANPMTLRFLLGTFGRARRAAFRASDTRSARGARAT